MKVGDLVRLSAYGEARSYNDDVDRPDNYYGLIIKITQNSAYPYVVQWYNQWPSPTRKQSHIRRELIYAKSQTT